PHAGTDAAAGQGALLCVIHRLTAANQNGRQHPRQQSCDPHSLPLQAVRNAGRPRPNPGIAEYHKGTRAVKQVARPSPAFPADGPISSSTDLWVRLESIGRDATRTMQAGKSAHAGRFGGSRKDERLPATWASSLMTGLLGQVAQSPFTTGAIEMEWL